MIKTQQELIKAIEQAVIRSVQDTAQKIFLTSQATAHCYVPVRTGFLKNSGKIEDNDRGATIQYTAPYAADVELGSEGMPIQGDYSSYIEPHYRTTKSGKRIKVKGYYQELKNKKKVTFRPKLSKFEYGPEITRIISHEGKQKGQFYLSRAIYNTLPELINDLKENLLKIY